MSKRAAAGTKRDNRLSFYPVPAGSPYERKLYTADEMKDYARERGRAAAKRGYEAKPKKKTDATKRVA